MADGTHAALVPAPAPAAAPAKVDGRRERSARSRRRILAAGARLMESGIVEPTAEQVAQEAGVSLRTVFRHFEEVERLAHEILGSVLDDLLPALDGPDAGQPDGADWPTVLDSILGRRAEVFERLLPLYAAIELHRHRSPRVAARHAALARYLSGKLEAALPASIGGSGGRREVLDLLLGPEAWHRLRVTQGLAAADAQAALRTALHALAGSRAVAN